jgi:hypothetical protein
MNHPSDPIYLLALFPVLWFAITYVASSRSGWFGLMEKFPDRAENPLATLAYQSGSLGGFAMRGVLRLCICPSGLRIGIMRIVGPLSHDFFVPWSEISVSRDDRLFGKVANLSFGRPPIGILTLPAEVADRMARTVGSLWPEPGSITERTSG